MTLRKYAMTYKITLMTAAVFALLNGTESTAPKVIMVAPYAQKKSSNKEKLEEPKRLPFHRTSAIVVAITRNNPK
jgi:hypothetical protein